MRGRFGDWWLVDLGIVRSWVDRSAWGVGWRIFDCVERRDCVDGRFEKFVLGFLWDLATMGLGFCLLKVLLGWVLLMGAWLGGIGDEPESLILAQSERWRHA